MSQALIFVGAVVVYVALTQFILPRAGVST